MRKKIRLGFIGGGHNSLIGVLHKVAAYMYDRYDIVGGVFNTKYESSIESAKHIGISPDRVYENIDDMISKEKKIPIESRIEAVCILTPNNSHYELAKKFLLNNYHIICEKPLTISLNEAKELYDLKQKSNLVFAVTHTYTGYPMVRQMTKMISVGLIGEIQRVDAQYLQGWINPIIHDHEKRKSTWRLDPKISGVSSCVADIGTHAFNMLELVTGLKVHKILADLNNLYNDNPLDIDANILVRMSNGAKGVIRSSQIATGEENNLRVNIYGTKGYLKWQQENPNKLYYLSENEPVKVLTPGHEYNYSISINSTKLPPGHPEGIFDAMGNIYLGAAKAIRGDKHYVHEFPTINEGVRGIDFIEKVVDSNNRGNVWLELEK